MAAIEVEQAGRYVGSRQKRLDGDRGGADDVAARAQAAVTEPWTDVLAPGEYPQADRRRRRQACRRAGQRRGCGVTPLRVTINGARRETEIDGRMLLVEAVRVAFGLEGSHIGCLTGDCGACTIELDGQIVKSCLLLAQQAEGREIREHCQGD